MKKIIIIFLSLMIVLNFCAIGASAKNIAESTEQGNLLGITDEEMSIVNPDGKFHVLKIYETNCIFDFSSQYECSIDEITAPEKGLAFFLITENWSDQDPRKIWIDGDKIKPDQNQHHDIMEWQIEFINDWSNILKNASLTKDIYDDIEVTRIYCTSQYLQLFGSCLYIITNLGDYICYRNPYPSVDNYLMTVEEFRSIATQTVEELEKSNGEICSVLPTDILDLSEYKVDIQETTTTQPEINEPETATNSEVTTTVDEQTTNSEITTAVDEQTENITVQTYDVKNGCASSLTSMAIIIPALSTLCVIKKKKED